MFIGHFAYLLYLYMSIVISVYSSLYIFSIFYFGRKKHGSKKADADLSELTVLIPVYREDESLFEKCVESVRKQGVGFVVIGNGCNEPYKGITKRNGGRFIYLKENIGKKGALSEGIKTIRSRYVMFLDSDTILPKGAAIGLLSRFDERTGGVGAEIRIMKENNKFIYYPSEMLQRLRQIAFKAMSHFDKVLVLSGQCAVYRREIITDFITSDKFLNNRFMGKKMIVGDDIMLTKYVNISGYKTRIAQEVIVTTKGQNSFGKLVKQAVRWSRSGYINFINGIRDGSLFKNGTFYVFSLIYVYTLPIFILFLLALRGGLLADIIIRRGIINGGELFIKSFVYTPRLFSAFVIPYLGIKIFSFTAVAVMLFLLLRSMKNNRLRFLSYGSIMLLVMFVTSIYAIFSIGRHDNWLTR